METEKKSRECVLKHHVYKEREELGGAIDFGKHSTFILK
jgi:hypothetical protein